MVDRAGAESPAPRLAAGLPLAGRKRLRALVGCTVLALALHVAFIAEVGGLVPGPTEPAGVPMSVRTVEGERQQEVPKQSATALPEAGAPLVTPTAAPQAQPRSRPRAPTAAASRVAVADSSEAGANSAGDPQTAVPGLPLGASTTAASSPAIAVAAAVSSASGTAESGEAPLAVSAAGRRGEGELLVAAGDEPPPVYRPDLPSPVTLHYRLRRGFMSGTAQIRWQPSGDRYRLLLEAQMAGSTLLKQTSEGGIDATGLAPLRFLDQRARRSAVAANFRRDDGRITFSGARAEWPLLAGSQDRLSWMIQLAGVAAAGPERLVEGGRIAMVVVGARGDASVWTFRYAGLETIETASATVRGVKLVRDARSAYDTSAEVWLDPERSYLPARATLRNSTGAFEYDLLLERSEPE